jgi:hypothetical protein
MEDSSLPKITRRQPQRRRIGKAREEIFRPVLSIGTGPGGRIFDKVEENNTAKTYGEKKFCKT